MAVTPDPTPVNADDDAIIAAIKTHFPSLATAAKQQLLTHARTISAKYTNVTPAQVVANLKNAYEWFGDNGYSDVVTPSFPATEPSMSDYALARSLRLATGRSPVTEKFYRNTGALRNTNGTGAHELGIRFQVLQSGTITGIRFWRASSESGTTTVKLWNDQQTMIGSAVAVNPVVDQWNEVTFVTPVVIETGRLYTASFNTNSNMVGWVGAAEAINQDGCLLTPTNYSFYADSPGQFPNIVAAENRFYYVDPIFVPTGNKLTVRSHVTNHPIFVENLKTGDWDHAISIADRATDNQICGYADRDSVAVGETINFKIRSSAAPDQCRIDIYRYGYYAGAGARKIKTETITTVVQTNVATIDNITKLYQYSWSNLYTLVVPSDWVSGFYVARLTQVATGKQSEIWFVVRNDVVVSDILFNVSFDNYYAYNNFSFNGSERYGLYNFRSSGSTRSQKTSKNRPFDAATYGHTSGERPTNYEVPAIRWLERLGYRVSYCVNEDISAGIVDPKRYQILLDCGHNEYWTQEYFDACVAMRDAGKHLVFLSANTAYWRVRYEDKAANGSYRTVVCYKSPNSDGVTPNGDADPIKPTTRFRDTAINKPEFTLLGVGISGNHKVSGYPWKPTNFSDPLFANTGFKAGDEIAGGVGLEWDLVHPTIKPPLKSGTQLRILADSAPTAADANNAYDEDFGVPFPQAGNRSNSVFYEAPSGGKVFALGSCYGARMLDAIPDVYADLFGDGLPSLIRTDYRFQRLFYNILTEMKVWGGYPISAIADPPALSAVTPTPTPTPTPAVEISHFATANAKTDPFISDGNRGDNNGPGDSYELAVRFKVTAAAQLKAVRIWIAAGEPKTARKWRLWDTTTQQIVIDGDMANLVSDWNRFNLATPFTLVVNREYFLSYSSLDRIPIQQEYFSVERSTGILVFPQSQNTGTGSNGILNLTKELYPVQGFKNTNYYIDPIVVPS